MNDSGQSVGEAQRFLKIALEDVYVFHDEIDLAPGKLKVKTGGGNAGHNGLRSIEAHIGNAYQRVRIGVGHPGVKDAVAHYVLHDFAKVEYQWLEPLLDAMAASAPFLAKGDAARFLSQVALKLRAEDPPRRCCPRARAKSRSRPHQEVPSRRRAHGQARRGAGRQPQEVARRPRAARREGVAQFQVLKPTHVPPKAPGMTAIISIENLSKTYASGFEALKGIDLAIRRGEIFALLGPNGAGKTTLISIICGIVTPSSGSVKVDGMDIAAKYRRVRAMIGLVPQELTADMFETVWNTVSFSRGLFGKAPNPAYIEKVLKDLTLWDKKDSKIMTLSGGMKRRVMIAKALSHEPTILFLDEPTAGVDVELRQEMWQVVRDLRAGGCTIILTTHYIEEAEEMADRVGVINKGELILVEEKDELMRKLGKKQLVLHLSEALGGIPAALTPHNLELSADGRELTFTYDTRAERTGITALLNDMRSAGLSFSDLNTSQSSLEDIFVDLVRGTR